ncbi:type I restriction enzyme HsdR N-terminal domain-containing protein [Engelhardtia mirabilis]|uniref:Type I restriction enzyme R protein N-terminal domain-containing protein n=1 Tax=Engelhardtia mirabilis TaxID=2528011 RepID=A0A518BH04_9BACT|nr:hypothetical protein Pla133_13270 [Planctomycetes bacterium Pla133]QDV00587.1 hypothetical protein Pla86_13260 [Planctomycetes bacterium Pla86]
MADLKKAVEAVRERIGKHRGARQLNEENTKATLIEPVLRALGWAVEDLDEVQREYRRKRSDKPVDYALLDLRTPLLFVEAKALGHDLQDPKWTAQIMGYATVAGVEWVVLTNGDEYRIYNSHAAVHVDEKLFRSVSITEESQDLLETLELLSKARMQENRLRVLWRAQFVDRQVGGVLEELFSAEGDMLLVNLIERQTKDLTVEEIRSSLGRCQVELDFPLPQEGPPPALPKGRRVRTSPGTKAAVSDGAMGVSLADLLEAGLIAAPLELKRTYKGKELRARVEADGAVTIGRERFQSLSQAAAAARASVVGMGKDGKLPATNGWDFWRCPGTTGKVGPIGNWRERLLKERGQVG